MFPSHGQHFVSKQQKIDQRTEKELTCYLTILPKRNKKNQQQQQQHQKTIRWQVHIKIKHSLLRTEIRLLFGDLFSFSFFGHTVCVSRNRPKQKGSHFLIFITAIFIFLLFI